MDIKQIGPSTYFSGREIRKARVNKLINTEIEQSRTIGSMAVEEQKKLNSYYNDILSDIYNIRNNHSLNQIDGLSEEKTIDADLHDRGKRERSIKETYRDSNGINNTRRIWKDGTVEREKNINDKNRLNIVKWPDGVTECNNDFSVTPEKASQKWIKDFFKKNTDVMDKSFIIPGDIQDGGKKFLPPNFTDFEKQLDTSISDSEKTGEKRTFWEKDSIKQRQRTCSNNLVETVTNWEHAGIKEKKISDQSGDFSFSRMIQKDSIESIKSRYKDTFIEKNTNYDNGSMVYKYKKGNNSLEYASILSEGGKRLNYTQLTDSLRGNKKSAVYSDDMRFIKLEEPFGNRKVSIIDFPEKNMEINYNAPGIERNTIIEKNGAGMDIKSIHGKGLFKTSWLPDREVLRYEKNSLDGLSNKCYFYKNNSVRNIVNHPGGNSYDLLELPNHVIKRNVNYKNGVRDSTTWFDTGEQRRTVRYPDNSLLVDLLYGQNMQKQGIKFPDGTCYLFKNWGNGVTQQCFCWPQNKMAHLSTEFEQDGLFENKTIYPDSSYKKEVKGKDWQKSMNFSKDPLLERIYESNLQEILSSPLLGMKLRENPFHNPFLTLDPQLWAHAVIKYGAAGNMGYSPKITDNIQKLPYIKMNFRLSFQEEV
jgi:hypothetical protein